MFSAIFEEPFDYSVGEQHTKNFSWLAKAVVKLISGIICITLPNKEILASVTFKKAHFENAVFKK